MLWGVLAASVLVTGAPAQGKKGRFSQEDYVSELLTLRRVRDEEFGSRKWSPLAVVAIAALNRPRTTIGSGSSVDLRLDADDVAAVHAEILREQDASGRLVFRMRAVAGKLWTDVNPQESIQDFALESGVRVRVGRFIIYWDNLGTFGPVIRALDFASPPYTHFSGLSYFPPDPKYRIQGTVIAHPKAKKVKAADTHGWTRPAWRYGEAVFMIRETEYRLVLLLFNPKPGPDEKFFIAFTDTTRGKETYPAARYLEVGFVPSGPIVLDFNLATNPLCAYNRGFACPLPPRENRLPIPIRAGEKLYPFAPEH